MSVTEPEEARRMFASSPNMMLSLTDDDDDSKIALFYGKSTHANDISGLIQALRTVATKYNMTFQPKQHGKEITPKDYPQLRAVSESLRDQDMTRLCEGFYGTTRSSYLQLDKAKLIVQHASPIDPRRPGARSQKISAIFAENAAGARKQLRTTDLKAARALVEQMNLTGKFPRPPKVTQYTLAANAPAIRGFMEWTENFIPHKALMEYGMYDDSHPEEQIDRVVGHVVDNFDPQQFLASDHAQQLMSPDPAPDDDPISKADLMSALASYLTNEMRATADFDGDFSSEGKESAETVWGQVESAIEHAGYKVMEDDAFDDGDMLDDGIVDPVSGGSLTFNEEDDMSMGDDGGDDMGDGGDDGSDMGDDSGDMMSEDNHNVLTREDVLLPSKDQGGTLSKQVSKSVVHDDPAHPGEESVAGNDYIQRMRQLAGFQSGRPF